MYVCMKSHSYVCMYEEPFSSVRRAILMYVCMKSHSHVCTRSHSHVCMYEEPFLCVKNHSHVLHGTMQQALFSLLVPHTRKIPGCRDAGIPLTYRDAGIRGLRVRDSSHVHMQGPT